MRKPIRILHLISSAGLYGAETVVINLASALEQLGCNNRIAVFNNSLNPHTEIGGYASSQGLPVKIIDCSGRVDWNAVCAIRNCIKADSIDVVHTHGYKSDLYGYVAARQLSKTLVATCHGWIGGCAPLRLYGLLDRFVLRYFHRVVVVSEALAGSFGHIGISQERLVTIFNGVEVAAFKNARPTIAEEIGKGGRVLVGTVGRLDAGKGIEYLLRAVPRILADFPNTLFAIVGDGPARKNLEIMARDLRIENHVIFIGFRRDMPGVYASIDILAHPSLAEGMPMTILEALAAGKPVVATNVGAIPALIKSQQTGLLVNPRDTIDLSNTILRLLSDATLRAKLGSNGQTLVTQQFSIGVMARRYLDLYRKATDSVEDI